MLGDKPVDLTYANVLYNQAGEYFEKADYKKAAELYIEALEEHKENHHTDMDTLRIQCALGNAYKYSGEIDLAIDTYTEAIGTLKSTKELDDDWTEEKEREYYSELINVYYLRGTAHFEKNDLYLADEDCKKCFENLYASLVDDEWRMSENIASIYNLVGKICTGVYSNSLNGKDEYEELKYTIGDAYDAFNLALMHKGIDVIKDEETADAKESDIVVSGYLFEKNESVFGYEGEESAIENTNWLLQNPDEETAVILTNRLTVEYVWGDFEEAVEDGEAALKIYEMLPVSKRYNISRTYFWLSIAKIANTVDVDGKIDKLVLDECYDWVEKGLEYDKKWYGDIERTAISYEHMGSICLFLNNYEEAIENYKEAKRIYTDLEFESDIIAVQEFIDTINQLQESGDEGSTWTLEKINVS